MKKLSSVVLCLMAITLLGTGCVAKAIQDLDPYYKNKEKIICSVDKFSKQRSCHFNTLNVGSFYSSMVFKSMGKYNLNFSHYTDNWTILKDRNRNVRFLIDDKLYSFKYELRDTSVRSGKVWEYVEFDLNQDMINKIINSKSCFMRVYYVEAEIDQRYKDLLKQLKDI